MSQDKFTVKADAADIQTYNGQEFLSGIQKEYKCFAAPIADVEESLTAIFNDMIEIHIEGNVKRACFHLLRFIDRTMELTGKKRLKKKSKLQIIGIFIDKVLKHLGVELDRKQAAICAVLYEESGKMTLTEENLSGVIQHTLKRDFGCGINKKEVYLKLEELVVLGIVLVGERRYRIKETIDIRIPPI